MDTPPVAVSAPRPRAGQRSTADAHALAAVNPVGPRPSADQLAQVGAIANAHAAADLFADYRSRRAANTLRRQDAALAAFAYYLAAVTVPADPARLASDPLAWQGLTWGLVEGFRRWQLQRGYAIGTVNGRLYVVKTYARLAMEAGALDRSEWTAIAVIKGYDHTEGRNVDAKRPRTRVGAKKAEPVSLTQAQAEQLKRGQPDTPQGRRDALMLCLLLDHGLRAGEVTGLQVSDLDLAGGELRFYRPKVDKTQTHRLTRDALAAARAYFEAGDAPAEGAGNGDCRLLRSSRRGGRLGPAGWTTRMLSERVRVLGRVVGVEGLSAHDLRHYWATRAARNGTPIDRLQDAGGWSSPAMPLRYVEAAKIANEGVRV